MATFVDYAEVLTPQHEEYKVYAAGIRKTQPGVRLGDVLERTGGVYRMELEISRSMRDQMREAAQISSDKELLAIANRGSSVISLEHLRGLDPDTMVVIGHRLNFTPEESAILSPKYQADLSPKDAIYSDLHPE